VNVPAGALGADRSTVVRRGQLLTWATIGYNSLEAVVSLVAGALAGSVALIGFGFDSLIELGSGVAALWRLRSDARPHERERAERRTLRVIGVCFLLLAGYVLVESGASLISREAPDDSIPGIVIAAGSLIVMPLLARAKRRVAGQLSSAALTAEARQTEICWYLSLILLCGLLLNAALQWWWADPVAALAMVPLIGYEGVEALRGRTVCAECAEPII
jgi:divalent metal cation (Fe/Co/Zn/Cd) transporter